MAATPRVYSGAEMLSGGWESLTQVEPADVLAGREEPLDGLLPCLPLAARLRLKLSHPVLPRPNRHKSTQIAQINPNRHKSTQIDQIDKESAVAHNLVKMN